MPRVALVTAEMFPDLWVDDHLLRDALRKRGAEVDAVCWDAGADWPAYDLAVIRSTWDYTGRLEEFLAWTRTVPRLANPADVIAWNTDKRYLRELAAAGLPVTPTEFIEPGEAFLPPPSGDWVIKPTVSVGSQDSGRYRLPDDAPVAEGHVARLHGAGRTAMLQPYLDAVDTAGETSLLYLSDPSGELAFSHSIRKGALLTGPDQGTRDKYQEDITARVPSEAELAVGAAVLRHAPEGLLYARVDLIPGPDGSPLLVELELTEPSLFFGFGPGSAERLADGILGRLG